MKVEVEFIDGGVGIYEMPGIDLAQVRCNIHRNNTFFSAVDISGNDVLINQNEVASIMECKDVDSYFRVIAETDKNYLENKILERARQLRTGGRQWKNW